MTFIISRFKASKNMYETKKGYTNHDTHISIAFNFAFILFLLYFYFSFAGP